MMLKIVNTSPGILKQGIADAIADSVSCYDVDFRAKRSDTDIDTVIDTDTETETVNTNFTRKRVLTMEKTINLLLSMQGGSLKKELYESGIGVTASAFVQQRKKIPWIVFEDAFENFNRRCKDTKTYKGYRVLAVDGTGVNMARNPKAESFMQNASNPKGYNQLHVNPLYDILRLWLTGATNPTIRSPIFWNVQARIS